MADAGLHVVALAIRPQRHAQVVRGTRFLTYDVKLDSDSAAYCTAIMAMPPMQEWLAAANAEPDEVVELDVEF
jgi:hypothetical protein